MGNVDIDQLVKEIKERGLTAYEISKHTNISEAGINKILNGTSKNPRQSTLTVLHNYLFGKTEETINDSKEVRAKLIEFFDFYEKNKAKIHEDLTFKYWKDKLVLVEAMEALRAAKSSS